LESVTPETKIADPGDLEEQTKIWKNTHQRLQTDVESLKDLVDKEKGGRQRTEDLLNAKLEEHSAVQKDYEKRIFHIEKRWKQLKHEHGVGYDYFYRVQFIIFEG
jgi:hypothetical protein